jgi:hypothetical protein
VRIEFPLWHRTIKVNGEEIKILSGPGPTDDTELTIWPVKDRKSDKAPTHTLVCSKRRVNREPGSDQGSGEGSPF